MKIAIAAYRPEWHADWVSLAAKVSTWVRDAAGQGADLLVFPEYAGIEAALIGQARDRSPTDLVDDCVAVQEQWIELNMHLAMENGVHILAGSIPWQIGDKATNMAALCSVHGNAEFQVTAQILFKRI